MRICILVEGSYPYVVGGVSAWLQMLISGMPEHEFIIYSIGAQEQTRGQFSYALPPNVVDVKELFLDSILRLKSPAAGRYKLHDDEKKNLEALICGDAIDIVKLIEMCIRDRYLPGGERGWKSIVRLFLRRTALDGAIFRRHARRQRIAAGTGRLQRRERTGDFL